MKTTINKSQIMKRAWSIFKGKNPYSYSFSAALRRAWEVEKENVAFYLREAEKAEETARIKAIQEERRNNPVNDHSPAFYAGIAAYYDNAPRGTYFGD